MFIYPKNIDNIQFLFNNKDPTPRELCNNIFYQINCLDCPSNSSTYIGQSSRSLKIRVYEHKLSVRNKKSNTALSTHAAEHSHSFDYDNAKILVKIDNYYKRSIAEMLHIKIAGEKANNFKREL